MTPLTSTLGPWLAPLAGGAVTRRKREISIIAKLVQQLPQLTFFRQILQPSWENVIAFQMCGFKIDLEQTIEINTGESLDDIWCGFQDKIRNQIRASNKVEKWSDNIGLEEFISLHVLNIKAKNVADRLDIPAFTRLHAACVERGLGRIVGLRNTQGDATAALFLVQSAGRMHHLLQTRHPVNSSSGAIQALIWNAISVAHKEGLVYDLDGLPNREAAARLLRYGGRLSNRFIITRGSPTVIAARSFYKGLTYQWGRHKRFI